MSCLEYAVKSLKVWAGGGGGVGEPAAFSHAEGCAAVYRTAGTKLAHRTFWPAGEDGVCGGPLQLRRCQGRAAAAVAHARPGKLRAMPRVHAWALQRVQGTTTPPPALAQTAPARFPATRRPPGQLLDQRHPRGAQPGGARAGGARLPGAHRPTVRAQRAAPGEPLHVMGRPKAARQAGLGVAWQFACRSPIAPRQASRVDGLHAPHPSFRCSTCAPAPWCRPPGPTARSCMSGVSWCCHRGAQLERCAAFFPVQPRLMRREPVAITAPLVIQPRAWWPHAV